MIERNLVLKNETKKKLLLLSFGMSYLLNPIFCSEVELTFLYLQGHSVSY